MTRLETGPIWHRLQHARQRQSDLSTVLNELERITNTLDDMCDDADAEPLPGKGLLTTDTVRAVIRGDQP